MRSFSVMLGLGAILLTGCPPEDIGNGLLKSDALAPRAADQQPPAPKIQRTSPDAAGTKAEEKKPETIKGSGTPAKKKHRKKAPAPDHVSKR